MKPEELRIGNWVNQGGKYENRKCTAYEIYGFSRLSNSEYYKEWKPIPITEQWLLDFGFELNPYQDKYELGDVDVECDKTKGRTELWLYGFPHIKYIHQLQNLYYALTGEELHR